MKTLSENHHFRSLIFSLLSRPVQDPPKRGPKSVQKCPNFTVFGHFLTSFLTIFGSKSESIFGHILEAKNHINPALKRPHFWTHFLTPSGQKRGSQKGPKNPFFSGFFSSGQPAKIRARKWSQNKTFQDFAVFGKNGKIARTA